MGSLSTRRRRRRSYVRFHGNRTSSSIRSDSGADSAHAGSSVGRSRSCLAGLEITTPQGAEQINRPDARIGWEGIGLMQFVVVVPEFATVADCYTDAKVLMLPVCGVPLLLRTLATAVRAGAAVVLPVWRGNRPNGRSDSYIHPPFLMRPGTVRL